MTNPIINGVGKFKIDERVCKVSGSQWCGKVVGFYSTELTPIGYVVESDTEKGSVQIYPEKALQLAAEINLSPDTPTQGDWIPWHGGECPVHPDTVVEVKYADGVIIKDLFGSFDWSITTTGVGKKEAYRIVTTYAEKPEAGIPVTSRKLMLSAGEMAMFVVGVCPDGGSKTYYAVDIIKAIEANPELMERIHG